MPDIYSAMWKQFFEDHSRRGSSYKDICNGIRNLLAKSTIPITCSLSIEEANPYESVGLIEIGRRARVEAERAVLLQVLKQTGNNKREASRILKISYRTIINKVKEYDVNRDLNTHHVESASSSYKNNTDEGIVSTDVEYREKHRRALKSMDNDGYE